MMNDSYVEQIVASKPRGPQFVPVAITFFVFALGVFVLLLVPTLGLMVMVGGGILAAWAFPGMHIEYEYIFTNGDLDVAIIKNKATRKECAKVAAEDVVRVLKYDDPKFQNELDVNKKITFKYFTSFDDSKKEDWYALMTKDKAVILELNEKSLAHVKQFYKKVWG
ncbi:MAG: hypothetical protein IKO61_00980 [Lachnospiraceae bacterium]|nr:hypothetical protein [Lachnospiraceae bacterium]